MKESRLAPRIVTTAVALFSIYSALTLACGLSYYWAGMQAFDAVSHAFSTVAIGGFSTKDASIGYWDSPRLRAWRWCSWCWLALTSPCILPVTSPQYPVTQLQSHPELAEHLALLERHRGQRVFHFPCRIVDVVIAVLYQSDTYGFTEALRKGAFETISIATTTGFATADYSVWPTFLPFLLLLSAFAGACAGSTVAVSNKSGCFCCSGKVFVRYDN